MASPEGYQPSPSEIRDAEQNLDDTAYNNNPEMPSGEARLRELTEALEAGVNIGRKEADRKVEAENNEGLEFANQFESDVTAREQEIITSKKFKKMTEDLSGEGLPMSEITFMAKQLIMNGYNKIDDLAALSREDVLRLNGVGKRSIQTIEFSLSRKGLQFKE